MILMPKNSVFGEKISQDPHAFLRYNLQMTIQLQDPSLFKQQAFIAGKWIDSSSENRITVSNPANSEILGSVPSCTLEETRLAISAAKAAQELWRQKTAKERSNILRAWLNLVIENKEDLACII